MCPAGGTRLPGPLLAMSGNLVPAALGATLAVKCSHAAVRKTPLLVLVLPCAASHTAARLIGLGGSSSRVLGAPTGAAHSVLRVRLAAVRGCWWLGGMRRAVRGLGVEESAARGARVGPPFAAVRPLPAAHTLGSARLGSARLGSAPNFFQPHHARRRSPARWSTHAPATTGCKWPRARSVVRTP